MWLSHHWPSDYDRCSVIGGMHICRRCLVLYPVAFVSAVALSIGDWWTRDLDAVVLWLFPLPGVIEFVVDNLKLVAYSPRRQMLLTAPGAFAAGVGYVRYLDDTFDTLVWSVVGVYTFICVLAAVAGWMRKGTQPPS